MLRNLLYVLIKLLLVNSNQHPICVRRMTIQWTLSTVTKIFVVSSPGVVGVSVLIWVKNARSGENKMNGCKTWQVRLSWGEKEDDENRLPVSVLTWLQSTNIATKCTSKKVEKVLTYCRPYHPSRTSLFGILFLIVIIVVRLPTLTPGVGTVDIRTEETVRLLPLVCVCLFVQRQRVGE